MKKIVFMILSMGLGACLQQPPTIKTGLEGTKLPSFNLLLMDSTTRFNTDNLPTGKPIVLFYFNPDCPYCQAQTEAIISNIKALQDIEFCIFTYASFHDTKKYSIKYKLSEYKNIIVGQDYQFFFGPHFQAGQVPYLAIYDADKKLKQVVIGRLNSRTLKNITHG